MKKFLAVPLFAACVFMTANAFAEDVLETNQGSNVEVHVGYNSTTFDGVSTADSDSDLSVGMWQFGGSYTYQMPDELYGRFGVDYSTGSKTKDGVKFKPRIWELEAALGWTWAFAEAGMVSPFIALGYHNSRLKANTYPSYKKPCPLAEGSDQTDGEVTIYEEDATITAYGFLVKLGVDVQYMFTNRLAAGVLASIGLPISNKVKIEGGERAKLTKTDNENCAVPWDDEETGYTDTWDEYDGKADLRSNLVFDVKVPIVYHIDMWKFGVRFNFSYFPFRTKEEKAFGKDDEKKSGRTTFGAALTAGCIF